MEAGLFIFPMVIVVMASLTYESIKKKAVFPAIMAGAITLGLSVLLFDIVRSL